MRRSAKRPRFIVPFADNATLIKEPSDPVISSTSLNAMKSVTMENERSLSPLKKRSVSDILGLLEEEEDMTSTFSSPGEKENAATASFACVQKPVVSSTRNFDPVRMKSSSRHVSSSPVMPVFEDEADVVASAEECPSDGQETFPSAREIYNMNKSTKEIQPPEHASYFSVVYCKRSGKKHKKWEGDGVLVVRSRSAVLKDVDGKIVARGIGYKVKEVTSIEEGGSFFIGGKECEIQGIISEGDYLSGKCFQGCTSTSDDVPSVRAFKKFQSPCSAAPSYKTKKLMNANFEISKDAAALYMPKPNALNQWNHNHQQFPVVEVKVDSFLSQHLRAHQKEGVIFLYECIMGFRNFNGKGAILGDQMGLGKTLQCITLIWTLYKQGPYGGKPVLRKILIITPSSLVKNWQSEFYKWLGKERIPVFAVGQDKKVKDFVHSNYSVLIISYEMYVRSAQILAPVKFDLVICDEGHRLKNFNIKTFGVIMSLPTQRRILLTGTPIQNDLEEFYAITEFVNPGILGHISAFRRVYVEPIKLSQSPECSEEDKKLGEARAAQLSDVVGAFFLRRTQEVINKYLPPKYEIVVFCRPSEMQCTMYEHLLQSRAVHSVLTSYGINGDISPLQCISVLRKICNHPSLLYNVSHGCEEDHEVSDGSLLEHMQGVFPEDYVHNPFDSGKLKVVSKILASMSNAVHREKIVLVSNFTQTLNILEEFCKLKNYSYLRLDGSTNTSSRQNIVEKFNSHFSKEFIFLLSSKAGGVGLNLIGASRIVLFDIDWNPATDLQAMSRIWRDGQKRLVYIYRLITTGSIEEKIFQRQVSKQGLSGAVIETTSSSSLQFSFKELKDLFTFERNVLSLTHDSIQCNCQERKGIASNEEGQEEEISRPCQLGWLKQVNHSKNTSMAELLKWKHIPGPIFDDRIPGSSLENCEDITFLFVNKVNFSSSKPQASSLCHTRRTL